MTSLETPSRDSIDALRVALTLRSCTTATSKTTHNLSRRKENTRMSLITCPENKRTAQWRHHVTESEFLTQLTSTKHLSISTSRSACIIEILFRDYEILQKVALNQVTCSIKSRDHLRLSCDHKPLFLIGHVTSPFRYIETKSRAQLYQ